MRGHKLIGETFGLLTVVKKLPSTRQGAVLWYCECKCGGTKVTITTRLNSGEAQSCGCVDGRKIKA